ncbi:hypothetical protein HZS_2422 [Henneguya salminicola]|nr:hypothetical protein HZS_2422 [Henneguya salminicola]
MSHQVNKFLQSKIATGEYEESWQKIYEFYKKRLFHQLTEEILDFFSSTRDGDVDFLMVYQILVQDFSKRMNSISLARIIVMVAAKLKKNDLDNSISFIVEQLNHVQIKDNTSAIIIVKSYCAKLYLYKSQILSAHDLLAELRLLIEAMSNVDISHIYFYDASLFYHYQNSDYASYFHDSLKFFGLTESDSLYIDGFYLINISDDSVDKVYYIALSSVMSPSITNVGAVVYNKHISSHLIDSGCSWLNDLLVAFDSGDYVWG